MLDIRDHGGLFRGINSNIKSVQNGVFLLSGNTADITINSVDATKSIVLISVAGTSNNIDNQGFFVSAKLTNNTTINLTRLNGQQNLKVAWTVVEFKNIKSLQKGDVSTGDNTPTKTVTVNAINPSKAILFFNYSSTDPGPSMYQEALNGTIDSSTSITFSQHSTAKSKNVHWQLVEFK